MQSFLVLALFLVPVAAPAGSDPVRALLDTQVAAWNKKDLDGYMAGYWKSDQLTFFGGGTVTTGWQATLDRYKQRYQGEGKEMGTLSFTDLHIETLAKNVSLARGGWHLKMSAGKELKGLFTVIVKKLPEGWRIIHDHSSMD
jgi:ketosteroid isomerase-like protein